MRASFLGCPIDVLTMADTVELARRAMHRQQRLQHVALNVAKFVNMRFDPVLATDVASSDLISIGKGGLQTVFSRGDSRRVATGRAASPRQASLDRVCRPQGRLLHTRAGGRGGL